MKKLNDAIKNVTKEQSNFVKWFANGLGAILIDKARERVRQQTAEERALRRATKFVKAVEAPAMKALTSQIRSGDVTGIRLSKTLIPFKEVTLEFKKITAAVEDSRLQSHAEFRTAKLTLDAMQTDIINQVSAK